MESLPCEISFTCMMEEWKHAATSFCEERISSFTSQVCDSLGGDDAVGAGLHRPDDGGDPGQHAAAAEGVLHVPQPGRDVRGHRSAG